MNELDTISRMLSEQVAKRARLEAARAARAALKPEELEEFIAESVSLYQAAMSQRANGAAVQHPAHQVSLTIPAPTKPTLRQLITRVLRERGSLGMGDIFDEVARALPDAKYPSVASEIKRMKNDNPPLISEVSKNEKGHGIYALTAGGAR